MKTLLLIDSHALLHRFYHALPPLTTPHGDQIQAIYGIAQVLIKALGEGSPDYIAAALDRPEPTLRAQEYADYKIHRVPAADSLIAQIKILPALFEGFRVPYFSVAGFEADDIIGTLVEKFKDEDDLQIAIITGDLDLLQLVKDDSVVVDILKSGVANMLRYNEAGVQGKFGVMPVHVPDYKGLAGDASDNIPGVKGIGPKGARELLQEFGSIEDIYENIGLVRSVLAEKLIENKVAAFASKSLATIRRDAPIAVSSLEDLRASPPDLARLKPLFEQWGFMSLIRRMSEIKKEVF